MKMPRTPVTSISRTELRLRYGLAILCLDVGAAHTAHAFELEPFEYVAAPPGTTALFDYFIYGDNSSYHPVGGSTYTHDTGLTETVGLARATQFFAVGPLEGLVEILQPYGALTGARIGGASYQDSGGLGDTTLAVALWPYKNVTTRTYLGIATYVTVPDGAYNAGHAINLGANRFAYDPELALHQGFNDRWSVDLTADYIFYGNNNDASPLSNASLSQHATLQLQGFLNYAWPAGITTSIGYEGETGGQQYLAGVTQSAKTEFQEVRFVTSYPVTHSFQVLGEVNHQFQNVGGFKQDLGITLRALYTF
jgi:hypothetical protein